MERYLVKKTDRPLKIQIEAPGSKSITNRALLLAAMGGGESVLRGVLFSDDSNCFLQALQDLGFAIWTDREKKCVHILGQDGRIPKKKADIYVGSAGTAARFLTAFLAVSDGSYRLDASEQMRKRPMRELLEALEALGAEITYEEEAYHFPMAIRGIGSCAAAHVAPDEENRSGEGAEHPESDGENRSGKGAEHPESDGENRSGESAEHLGSEGLDCLETVSVELDIDRSSQFLSALLMTAPLLGKKLTVRLTGKRNARSYVEMTEQMMKQFGHPGVNRLDENCYEVEPFPYQARDYRIEPDVSAACYFYAMAAVTGGTAVVYHVQKDSMQGDMRFLEILHQMGCNISWQKIEGIEEEQLVLSGPAHGRLKGLEASFSDFSDQALTMAAIAPYADSPVAIRGIAHIRGQESDRIAVMAEELSRLGVRCEESEDGIVIYPGKIHGAEIETHEDHRAAMAFAVTGLRTDGVVIKDPNCCRKTFPEYFQVLEKICGNAG